MSKKTPDTRDQMPDTRSQKPEARHQRPDTRDQKPVTPPLPPLKEGGGYQTLFDAAKKASEFAYSPYSQYKVGAALLTKSGDIFTGCNVENASYGATNCAERTAIFKAVSEGQRDFVAIAVYVQSDRAFPPCGICRQVMAEFSSDLIVIYGNEKGVVQSNIKDLLPESFSL